MARASGSGAPSDPFGKPQLKYVRLAPMQMKSIIPSYLIVHILYFSTIQSILKVAFGFDDLKSNLSAAGVVLTAYLLTLGTAKLQRKQCEMWDKEQKKK
mmetsp:Transcript_13953/g.13725  ORF Transcript_13953/g.13725 Transcript_13953/m.13725 type:complete len:99 (-) Transcript_13953:106-402(-)